MAHSNREKRRAHRKAQKVARKAAWASLIGTSQNKKKAKTTGQAKRPPTAKELCNVPVQIKGKMVRAPRMQHAGPKCYNTGCKRCSPIFQ